MFGACKRQVTGAAKFKNRVFSVQGRAVRVKSFIAEGSYARIYETSDPQICMKHMRVQSQQQLQIAQRECQALLALRNTTNCLHAAAFYFDDELASAVPERFSELCIFMEYCRVTLQNALSNALSEEKCLNLFSGIVHGVCEMHSLGLIHRDLKIENILLTSNNYKAGDVRICDFGSVASQSFDANELVKNAQLRGQLEEEIAENTTPQYRAPELINLCSRFDVTAKSDIFALGVILYRMRFRCMPFNENELLSNYNCVWKIPAGCSELIRTLLFKMLVKNPASRPGIEELEALVSGKNVCNNPEVANAANESRQIAKARQSVVLTPTYRYNPYEQLQSNADAATLMQDLVRAYVEQRDFRQELHAFLETWTVNYLYMALLQVPQQQRSPEELVRNEVVKLSICLFYLICLQEQAKIAIFERYVEFLAKLGDEFKIVFCLASLARYVAALTNMVMQKQADAALAAQAINSLPPLNALLTLRSAYLHNFEANIIGFVCQFVANYVRLARSGKQLYAKLYGEFQEFKAYYQIGMQLEDAGQTPAAY